jgi:hypothetical protein
MISKALHGGEKQEKIKERNNNSIHRKILAYQRIRNRRNNNKERRMCRSTKKSNI